MGSNFPWSFAKLLSALAGGGYLAAAPATIAIRDHITLPAALPSGREAARTAFNQQYAARIHGAAKPDAQSHSAHQANPLIWHRLEEAMQCLSTCTPGQFTASIRPAMMKKLTPLKFGKPSSLPFGK